MARFGATSDSLKLVAHKLYSEQGVQGGILRITGATSGGSHWLHRSQIAQQAVHGIVNPGDLSSNLSLRAGDHTL